MNDIFGDKDWFVVDDILNLQEQNDLGKILTSNSFPWYLSEFYTVDKEEYDKFKHLPNNHDFIQMCHSFYHPDANDEDYKTNNVSHKSELADLLIKKIARYFNKKQLEVIRCKANLQHQVTGNKKEYHNTPHIDEDGIKHWVCIYYVNDSDGDTLFFDNKKDCNITDRISPKKGRFLFFKGEKLHTGSHPVKSPIRVVINIDFYYDR